LNIFNITWLICNFGFIAVVKSPNDTNNLQSVTDFFFMEAIALFLVCHLRHSNKQLFTSSFLLILRTIFNIIYITSPTREHIVYLRLSISIDLIIDILSVYGLFKYLREFHLILLHQYKLREATINWNVLRITIVIVQHLMLLSNTFAVNDLGDHLVYKTIAEIFIPMSLSYLITSDMEFVKDENENSLSVERYGCHKNYNNNNDLLRSENSIEHLDENTKVMVSAQGFVIKLMSFINSDD